MLQSVATLLFLAAAIVAAGLISALLVEEWDVVRRALGLDRAKGVVPLPPRTRLVALRPVPMLRVTPGALRRAA